MDITLFEIAAILGKTQPAADQTVQDIIIDSRLIKPGVVFIAIKGESHDGHDFAAQAAAQGAIAIIASKPISVDIPVFQVKDTRLALGQLAKAYRQRFSIPVIGITGSCGKTSTKALTASVLAQQAKTLMTEGTLNNDFGVPLTLFRLTAEDQFAVIEMGANHPGEIDYVANIAMPTVSVITNSGPVHLEGFGSLEGVRKAKGEIYQNLGSEGIGIVNADDEGAHYWMSLLQGKQVIRFGIGHKAEVSAKNIHLNDQLQATFHLCIADNEIPVHLPVIGLHQVPNALAAAAVGCSQGLTIEQIKAGLEAAPLVAKRGIMQTGYNNSLIIDDSYNANPKAFGAAIDMLMAAPATKHILVMGDMGELGSDSINLHASVGTMDKQAGVDALYSVGKLSQAASNEFGQNAYHFNDQASLVAALKPIAQSGVCFLIKGSKSSHMGDVVSALL